MRVKPEIDARARRVARKAGYKAVKSRRRNLHRNDLGGYMLIDPIRNAAIYGTDYGLSPDDFFLKSVLSDPICGGLRVAVVVCE